MAPDFQRRKIITALSVLGLGALGGCIPVSPRLIKEGEDGADALENSYVSSYGMAGPTPALNSYVPSLSSKAQQIFKTALTQGYVPLELNLPTQEQADDAIAQFRRMREKYAGRRELELNESYDAMRNMIPLLRMYVDLNTIDTKPKHTDEKLALSADGTITIPPGYRAVSIQTGYCLDEKLPANGRGDKMTLTNSSELIPAELQPLYDAMQMRAYNDKKYLDSMQKLMWTLRAAGQPNSLASHVDHDTLQLMDRALPGGANTFIDYHNSRVGKGHSIDTVKKSAAPSGQSIANQMFNAFLDGLSRNSPNGSDGGAPDDNRNYQMLSPGVASFSVGSAPLKPQIEIVNAGTAPFRINLSKYAMSPVKRQQHIAMYPTRRENLSYFQYPVRPRPGDLELLAKLKEKVNYETLTEGGRFLNDKLLKNISKTAIFRDFAFRLIKETPVTRTMINAMPYLGNALSAYEAISGKNWLNGRDLNAFERVASALGTIPGGGFLGSVFKERLVTVAGVVFAGAGFGVNQNLLGEDLSAYSQVYTNPLKFAGEYTADKITSNVKRAFVTLSQDSSFSKSDRLSMMRQIGTYS